MRVAAVQLRSGTSIGDNLPMVAELVKQAAQQGAQYVQTPEMTGIVQSNRKGLLAEIKPQDEDVLVLQMAELAAELEIWLHIGSHAVKVEAERAANRTFVFSPKGELVTTYDKLHMFDVDLPNGESWRESKIYKPGDAARLVRVDEAMVGLSVCYDLRFPELYKAQAQAGAQILTMPAAFTRQTGEAHWHVLLRARAIENGAFVIAAAQGGEHEDGRETYGHSMIVDPWGKVVAELDHDQPGVLIADIDLAQADAARLRIPNLANGREFVLQNAT